MLMLIFSVLSNQRIKISQWHMQGVYLCNLKFSRSKTVVKAFKLYMEHSTHSVPTSLQKRRSDNSFPPTRKGKKRKIVVVLLVGFPFLWEYVFLLHVFKDCGLFDYAFQWLLEQRSRNRKCLFFVIVAHVWLVLWRSVRAEHLCVFLYRRRQ